VKPSLIDPDEADDVWLSSAQVMSLFGGVTAMSLHRWMRDKHFPRPVKYSGRNYWSRRAVLAFRAGVQAR
jgi:predicted DNA-binding transcriptional regulator AlpA